MSISRAEVTVPLKVIYNSGKVHSIEAFYRVFQSHLVTANSKKLIKKMGAQLSLGLQERVPYHTPNMKPSLVKTRRNTIQSQTAYLPPLFLIGTDTLSRDWLVQHKALLIRRKAQGILVEAKSVMVVKKMRQLAIGLRLHTVSAYELARHLKLRYYPVLISKQYIEQ